MLRLFRRASSGLAVQWLTKKSIEACVLHRAAAASCISQSNSSYERSSGWGLTSAFGLAALGAVLTGQASTEATDDKNPTQEGWHLLDLPTRQQTFFKYEKRIRDLSSPEKVFEYFATERTHQGSWFMRPTNLLNSIVAVFPPEGSNVDRTGYLPGERPPAQPNIPVKESEFFKMFDVDGDGLISFKEYLLLVAFLSIPHKDVQIAFQMMDVDDDGSLGLEEFHMITDALNTKAGRHSVGYRAGREQETTDSFGLVPFFFGKDGTKKLDLKTFNTFLLDLHAEIVRLEFEHYDIHSKGYMTGKDFARSLVASVDVRMVDSYLRRVDALEPQLLSAQITLPEFGMFAELRQHLHKLSVAMEVCQNTRGKFDKADFQRAVHKIMGKKLSDDMVAIVFGLFDKNKDDSLAAAEFMQVLRAREGNTVSYSYGLEHQEPDRHDFFSCMRKCTSRGA